MKTWRGDGWRRLSAVVLAGLFLTGCATPRVDWASRVGNYTYDQVIVDYGPPDKYAKLSDGTAVAEWLTRRGYTYAYAPFGYGCYSWYHGAFYPGYIDT